MEPLRFENALCGCTELGFCCWAFSVSDVLEANSEKTLTAIDAIINGNLFYEFPIE